LLVRRTKRATWESSVAVRACAATSLQMGDRGFSNFLTMP